MLSVTDRLAFNISFPLGKKEEKLRKSIVADRIKISFFMLGFI
jgi:hypothetical protein